MLHNGRVARAAVTGMARLVSAELADWVAGNVAFPNGENLEKKC
jgi:mannitol 2-dehydrogenase